MCYVRYVRCSDRFTTKPKKKKKNSKRYEIGTLPWQQSCKFHREHGGVLSDTSHARDASATKIHIAHDRSAFPGGRGRHEGQKRKWRKEKGEQKHATENYKVRAGGRCWGVGVSYCISLERRMFHTHPFFPIYKFIIWLTGNEQKSTSPPFENIGIRKMRFCLRDSTNCSTN